MNMTRMQKGKEYEMSAKLFRDIMAFLPSGLSGWVLAACFLFGISASAISAEKKKGQPPAGVDSVTAKQADSLAKDIFGEKKDLTEAQRLFENGRDDFKAGEAFLAEADSLHRHGIDTTLKRPGGLFGTIKWAMGDSALTSGELDSRKRAESAFRRAQKEFERAMEVSPEMKEVSIWLAATYDRLKEWAKAKDLYREILNERQGDDPLWFRFGYACLQSGEYNRAVTAFEQAISIHYLVNEDSAKVPNHYRTYLGEAYIRTYQDRLALEQFRAARQNAASEADAEELQRTIDWIEWDDGGIAAAEYRDAAFRAESESRWNEAREAYLGGIKAARTERVRDELSYRLALLEFREGTKSDGLARMKELIDAAPDAPAEQRENYGKMLYGYAQDLEQKSDVHGALNYYLQATRFPWSGQGAGFLEIARLAANDPKKAIEHGTKALEFPMTDEQKQMAYRFLEDAYRTTGEWEKMKAYRQLQDTQLEGARK